MASNEVKNEDAPTSKPETVVNSQTTHGEEQMTAQPSTTGETNSDVTSLLQHLNLAKVDNQHGNLENGHKFWSTQPVPQFKEPNLLQTTEDARLPEGPILSDDVCRASCTQRDKLLTGFEWCELDLKSDAEIKELYELLDLHYVEDTAGTFRFNYSAQFLSWALMPPGWRKDWHIGVRTKVQEEGKRGKLVAFISGVPALLNVRGQQVKAVEINFLTVHHKLRNKRLAPVLIKEITRRCYSVGIYQALYTAGTVLPTPVSTCRYFHRSLDWEHLYRNGFSHIPRGSTELRQKLKYRLNSDTATQGLRTMKPSDVKAVTSLLTRYNRRFQLHQEFREDEIAHFLCSKASQDVVWSMVVEQDGKITDFISYYLLESSVLRSTRSEKIRAAYLYYYASEAAFVEPTAGSSDGRSDLLRKRLQGLVRDALILAKEAKFHVFNALTVQDNPLFLREEKFELGDGKLHYYLFNWRTARLPSGIDEEGQLDEKKSGGVGVVML